MTLATPSALPVWPRQTPQLPGTARFRSVPEDFVVIEELGFEPDGSGEHVFLYLEKRDLNTLDLVERVARLSGVAARHVGFSGLKDKQAVTRQWLSVAVHPSAEPGWSDLESGHDIRVLRRERHARKLKRGVHRANRFSIRLRDVQADRLALEKALHRVAEQGAPNYFGEQRFGRGGSSLLQARRAAAQRRKLSRGQRQRVYSALRAYLFNELLAQRVADGTWATPLAGDVCMLRGTRSVFATEAVDAELLARVRAGDVHPALPLWGVGGLRPVSDHWSAWREFFAGDGPLCDYLEGEKLALAWRATRLIPDDFCWQFCDDGSLLLDFALGAGNFATTLLAELLHCVPMGGSQVHTRD